MKRLILQRRYWVIPLAVWTAVVGASLGVGWSGLNTHTYELALDRGRFVFSMVESVRLWNARHGGVYAPVTDETQPNPHLKAEERDIPTPSGRPLTLINPAYMTRQVGEVVRELTGMGMHLTSLKPLNPGNAADGWEAAALRRFESAGPDRATEHAEFVGGQDGSRFRFIAPLVTEEPCLKCHEHQGYRVGDIRGGLSVAIPAADMLAARDRERLEMLTAHAAVWLLVAALTLVTLSRFRLQILSLKQAKEEQDSLVERRTAELKREVEERNRAEGRLRLLLEASGEGIYGVDAEGRCTFCNPTALRLLGLADADAAIGRDMHALVHGGGPDGASHSADECALAATYRLGEAAHAEEDTFWRADGTALPVEYRSHPLRRDGRIVGAVVSFSDIGVRKAHEEQLRKLSKAVENSPESVVITDVEGCIEYVNRRFEAVTGYERAEVVGENPRLLQSGETPLATYQEMWQTITAGKVWHGQLLNRRKDGDLYWEEAAISPIQDDRGRITHFVALKQDITERKQLEEQIWHQANFDALTGLANRHLFHDRLSYLIAQARRDGGHFAVLYLDLDRFKEVNDSFGHEVGDELLSQVAGRFCQCLRRSDIVARVGGDEFTALLPGIASADEALAVVSKLERALGEPFDLGAGRTWSIGASVGVAIYPLDGSEADDVLRSADHSMYRVKKGRSSGA
jgi:diguanylate cyclase (GGDEF)-like protein/PAS domain S-box-containing protein